MLRTRRPTAALLALSAVSAAACASGGADHAVTVVSSTREGTRIVVEDRGRAPMPARVLITRVDGERIRREVPVETWLAGADRATVTVPPDVEPENDVWRR